MEAVEEPDYESLPTASVAVNMFAGALAGITEHVVMYPFDSIKTRMQFLTPSPQAIYTSVAQAISKISTTEGVSALWRGMNTVVVGAGPAHALYFATYEHCRDSFRLIDTSEHQHLAHASAGALATIAHDGFMTPFDVIKQRMQLHGSGYNSIYKCAADILKAEGATAFYLSFPTTLMMSIPFQSIQFATYEYMRRYLNPSGDYNPMSHIVAGGIAGAMGAAITNPLDVAKTLLQTRGLSSDSSLRHASGLVEASKLIYRRHGLVGFSRGLQARVLSHMPSTAVAWTTYEFLKMIFTADSPSSSSSDTTPQKLNSSSSTVSKSLTSQTASLLAPATQK